MSQTNIGVAMKQGRLVLTCILFAALHWACSKADEVKCPPGFGLCGPSCVSLVDDASNCGACGHACGAGQACSAGTCRLDCFASLRAPIRDRWGTAWDGLERPPAVLADATAACAAIGGRLPTATEMHRVSWGGGNADVGQSYQVNDLWTLVPRDPTNQFTMKMSNGAASGIAATSALPYRCTCPAPTPSTFSGGACNGPPGQECFPLTGPNAGYNMDAQDRAALSVGGAMWECGFAGAQLPRFLTYAEAILDSLPNGTTSWLQTADFVRYDSNAVVRWSGAQPSWPASANTSYDNALAQYAFRCVGRATAPAASTSAPLDAFVGATHVAADAADRAAAAWAAAFDVCWAAGGHLPYTTELGALVQQGLGGGSGATGWTAEQEGYNGVNFLGGILHWAGTNGVDRRFGEYYSDYISWAYRTDPGYPQRCIYYPVDPKYVAPTGCNGPSGCDVFPLSGPSGAKVWMDTMDRAPATLIAAIGICRGLGGHLATERDFTETIRKGLANGSATYLHAVDLARGEFAPLNSMILRWTNVDRAYDDQYSTYSTWESLDDSRPYRCMWTNELR